MNRKFERYILLSGINLCDVAEKVENTARVTPLVIIPSARRISNWFVQKD
jgi:hypothetical protein